MHPINEYGTKEQKEKYIPRLGEIPTQFLIYFLSVLTLVTTYSKGRDHRLFWSASALEFANQGFPPLCT